MKSSRRLRHRALAVTAVGFLAVAGMAQPAAATGPDSAGQFVSAAEAEPGIAPAGSDETAVYLDSEGQVISVAGPNVDSDAALIGCTPVSGYDNPHRSSTGVAVSAHGWWNKGNCDGDLADVFNCLYEWYTDNTWRQKDCSEKKRLKPGGGSSYRTVAREDCDTTTLTSWRNHVDVDVVGEIDTGEKPYRQASVACRVD